MDVQKLIAEQILFFGSINASNENYYFWKASIPFTNMTFYQPDGPCSNSNSINSGVGVVTCKMKTQLN